MRIRTLISAAVMALALTTLTAPVANAASGPLLLRALATQQTQLLFQFFHGAPQTASPETCNASRANNNRPDVFLLPTLSFSPGDHTFECQIKAPAVLVDLGGVAVTEDTTGDPYPAADGTILHFVPKDLARICDDVVTSFSDPPAFVDKQKIKGVAVSTRTFIAQINRDANSPFPFFRDSWKLGHRGFLHSCFAGRKALVPLSRGTHFIDVDLTSVFGPDAASTHLTYKITRS